MARRVVGAAVLVPLGVAPIGLAGEGAAEVDRGREPSRHRLRLDAAVGGDRVEVVLGVGHSSSPFQTVTAVPSRRQRSPLTVTRSEPPRAEAWYASMVFRPSRSIHQGPRPQCAEPVTGSSGMPRPGAKKRETMS